MSTVLLAEVFGIKDPATVILTGCLWLAEAMGGITALYMLLRYIAESRSAIGREAEIRSIVLMVATGSAAAVASCWWFCDGPFLLAGWAGVRTVLFYFVMTVVAGTVALVVGWLAQGTKPAPGWIRLTFVAATGWAFLPCAMMLAKGRSPLALAMALLVTAPAVFGLRRAIGAETELGDPWIHSVKMHEIDRLLPYLFGTPKMRSGYGAAIWVAFCLQGAVVAAAVANMVTAIVLMIAGFAVVAWRWSASLRRRTVLGLNGLRWRTASAMTVGFILCLLTQLIAPSLNGTPRFGEAPKAAKHSQYFSVVLTQPKKKKETLVMPQSPQPAMQGKLRQPMIIPFDGPYWYFQPPLSRPDGAAHTAKGRATEVNIHSVDETPLIMEADQTLAKPVELSCCRELDVAVRNADPLPGRIVLAVWLRNSLSKNHEIVVLPEQGLRSSLGRGEHRSSPVDETVRFIIPQNATKELREFNEITVLFVPEAGHILSGTKVDVESFTLQP